MKRVLVVLCLVFLNGCATSATGQTFAHEDLRNAAGIATKNGYPARAAVWQAFDTALTAVEAQISSCKAAIAAALPKAPSPSGPVGLATITELGAEAVASGIPAAVKANCEPIPVPLLPGLPKLP